MQIKDDKGRIGTVTEERAYGVFAKPIGVEYKEQYGGMMVLTATFWTFAPDGTLRGIWFDDPLHTEDHTAQFVNKADARKAIDNLRQHAAQVLGASKAGNAKAAAASRENGKLGGRPRKVNA